MRPFFEVWLWMPLVWLCFLAALVILIITAVRRGACKRRRMPPPPWAVPRGPEPPGG